MAKPRPTKVISAHLRDQMIIHTKDQITQDLEALETFLTIPGYEILCAAIFSFVVEEFGKIIFLQQATRKPNGDYEINYSPIGGFKDHDLKFELADTTLPRNCVELTSGGFMRKSFTKGFIQPTAADWSTRLLILHTDFDQAGTGIARPPKVDAVILKLAVQNLENYVKSYPVP